MPRAVNPSPARQGIGWVIRDLRQDLGFSQLDLANALGCEQPTISAYEKGTVDFKYDTLVRIFDALGYDLDFGIRSRGEIKSRQQIVWNSADAGTS